MSFVLHPQLAADSHTVGDFPLCRLQIMEESRYPWFILVPRRTGVREIYELGEGDQALLWKESSQLGRALMEVFQGDKLNVAALGNLVPQLHLHQVVRYTVDAAWPAPVWGRFPLRAYALEERAARIGRLCERLPAAFRRAG